MQMMNSALSPNKKPALCRYFVSNGACFYGPECQFLHENPGQGFGVPAGPIPASPGQMSVGSRSAKRDHITNQRLLNDQGPVNPMVDSFNSGPDASGDQFLTPPFNGMANFPRLTQPGKGSHGSPVMGLDSGPVDDAALNEQFAAMALQGKQHMAMKGRNIGAKEFVPKSNSPAHGAPLTHSSSAPSFASYAAAAQAYGRKMTNTPPHHLSHNSTNLSVDGSPLTSPRPSPTNSPMVKPGHSIGGDPLVSNASTPKSSLLPDMSAADSASMMLENVGGTTYFYSQEDLSSAPSGMVFPNFTMYPGMLPHVAHIRPKSNQPSFFMPDELKLDILNRQFVSLIQMDPELTDLPREVDNYHNLVPLEPPPTNPMHKSSTFGYMTSVYKATNTKDGMSYCLRRIHGFRLSSTKCMAIIDLWKKMQHANIVQLRQVFTTKAFGDHSMVFVYDFHPGAENLMGRHFSGPSQAHQINGYNNPYNLDGQARPYSAGKGGGLRQQAGLLPESLIWSYIVQLSSALRTIHAHGLACRVIDPTKVLLTDKSRLRLNCVGIFDVLSFDASQPNPLSLMPQYQQEDLVSLGKTILALACNSIIGIQREHLQTSLDVVSRNYSADLKNLLFYLLNTQNRTRNVNDIMPMIGARFYTQLDSCQMRNDVIEQELSKEVENGRLFRLMSKLGCVNERPEYNMDPSWAETGDRYMLKLFRDYIFHQVDENGAPWLDMGHITQCLNKLDAGSSEKICLMSRDEQSVLVVTFSELKQCLENSFSELLQSQASPMLGFS